MAQHDKLTFTAEYCRARRIPYKIKNETLSIGNKYICLLLYTLPYAEIVPMINDACLYDPYTTFYIGLS